MTPRQTALKNVTLFFVTSIGLGVAVALAIDFFGLAPIGTGLAVLVLVYLVKVVYDIEVEKAERLERLNTPKG